LSSKYEIISQKLSLMLIEFTLGNYLSFKGKKTLSLEATSIKDNPDNIIEVGKYKLLRSVVLYGANSSGKSNFIKGLSKMTEVVKFSAKENSTTEIDVKPFLMSTETEREPSFFEIVFLINNIRYRYGFEADKKIIHSEWLYERKANKENLLFIRKKDSIEITNDFEEGNGIEEKTRDNALFLSVCDQFNGRISKKIISWFNTQHIFSGLHHEIQKNLTSGFLKDKALKTWIKDFLIPLGLGFNDFALVEFEKGVNHVVTYHNKYNKEGQIVDELALDLVEQESSGTNKLYDMAGTLVFGLKLGTLTVIDELDAKLHPLLTMAIVKLFHSSQKNAQLIFATHDTNLLNYGCFRRDQIYFTEKNRFEETDIYSLVEYRKTDGKKVRNDNSFEKDYIAGRYGAIPYVGDFSKLISDGESS
jgi:uncharacterized protein